MKWFVKMALLVVVGLGGCKGCREEVKPEPYPSRKLPVLADFKMCVDYDTGRGRELLEVTDTTAHQQLVFAASDTTGDVYEWQLGTEPSPRYGKTVSVYFRDQPVGGPNAIYPFSVKLKVTRTKNPYKVDSVASKERSFVLEAFERTFKKWRGNYIAHYTYAPNETFPLRIFDSTEEFHPTNPCLNIKYTKAGCDKHVRLEFYGRQWSSASQMLKTNELGNNICYPDSGYWATPHGRWFTFISYVFFSDKGRILNIQYFRQREKDFNTKKVSYYVIKAYKQ
jgi:hypothetical protein